MKYSLLNDILKAINADCKHLDWVTIVGHDPILPTPFAIGEAGAAALAAVGYLAAQLWYLKTQEPQTITIKVKDAAIAQRSHQYLTVINGITPKLWDPLSDFYLTQDNRWIQLHCNFPHHRQGVIRFLNCNEDKESLGQAVKNWQAQELEAKLVKQGLCAAMVRTAKEWEVHPQAQALALLPLLEITKIGNSAPKPLPEGNYPLSNLKVLDLTRVIAGPVCGKTLAEFGANVLNITSPHLPSIPLLVMDLGFGKRSAYLDLNQQQDKDKLIKLAASADIFCQSYRPNAFNERGLSAIDLASLNPGLIYVSFSAYSHVGPWANYHGYDSLVQSVTGMVAKQSLGFNEPRHLPGQTLDYITGYLGALGAMQALKLRATFGGSYLVQVSLAQTAHWLNNLPRVSNFSSCTIPNALEISHLLTQSETQFGCLEHLLPVVKLSKTSPFYAKPSVPLGSHEANF